MGKLKFLTLFLIIISIAGLTSWLLRTLSDEDKEYKTASKYEADYFLEDFVATAIDAKGKPSYRLEAKELKHFPVSTLVTLQKPYIEFYTDQTKPWQTWAEHGIVHETDQRMILTGKVRIHRAGEKNETAITLLTDSLTIDTRSKLAETEDDVDIQRGSDNISATGMRIDMLNDRLELLSKVQGKYEVPAK
ncbi:MAG: LPS export ABC transporter periplasmic protein LptC [Gammaproteobacteria bacterium]|nr:LPS export ABC transporter periplasmic protein LptC [Gammaproteobacteria bacterium]MDH5778818.1 LPS export ABC transporter periplasmic protein LptC [Gammaproteobacteria bacterium]